LLSGYKKNVFFEFSEKIVSTCFECRKVFLENCFEMFWGPESIFGKLFKILGNPEKQLRSPFLRISMFLGFLERPPPQCVFNLVQEYAKIASVRQEWWDLVQEYAKIASVRHK
jgi:hypothetical protein